MGIDQSRPFPRVSNQNLYLAIILNKEEEQQDDDTYFAILQVPANLPRFIKVGSNKKREKKQIFILLEDLIKEHLPTLFDHYNPVAINVFRLTRNSDLTLDEEGTEDLLAEIQKELQRRRWGVPVRLEIERGFHPYSSKFYRKS